MDCGLSLQAWPGPFFVLASKLNGSGEGSCVYQLAWPDMFSTRNCACFCKWVEPGPNFKACELNWGPTNAHSHQKGQIWSSFLLDSQGPPMNTLGGPFRLWLGWAAPAPATGGQVWVPKNNKLHMIWTFKTVNSQLNLIWLRLLKERRWLIFFQIHWKLTY